MHLPATRTINLIIAAALIAASFAGMRDGAQTATSATPLGTGIPAAPAGGIDPSKLPDIQGIHLGMTAQDMLPKLKALYPGKGGPSQFGVNPAPVFYLQAPSPPWTGDLYGNIDSSSISSSNTGGDKFTATFTGPPNKQVAVYLLRQLGFQGGKFPLPDTLIAALKQKYGPNPTMFPNNVLAWAFDEQGQPVTMPVSKTTSCATNQLLAPVNSVSRYAGLLPISQADVDHWLATKCGTG